MNTRRATFGFIASTLFAFVAVADEPKHLGKIAFPNSGPAAAQDAFIEGVLYLHNFEYAEAGAAFKRAQEIDPDFAMAYWGDAMALNHSLWGRQSTTTAREVIEKLGKTTEQRAAKAPTQREKDYIAAVEVLFGMTDVTKPLPKEQRDALYRDQMRRLHETYTDDNEATAFYGLSILGAGYGHRDYATYMRAAAVLTQVWDANRLHPGAAHYLIHAYDDPVHAPLGLPMARAYSKIAPSAAHAQHMTSHIFVAMGMWDDLVNANETAVLVELKSAEESGATAEASHYRYWLQYGYLQQGRIQKARELLAAARAELDDNPTQAEKMYYGAMYARYQLDAGEVPADLRAPEGVEIVSPHYTFAQAYEAIQKNELDKAQALIQNLNALSGGNPEVTLEPAVVDVLRKELNALLMYAGSEKDAAISLLQEAAEDSTELPIKYGPPQMTKPAYEVLGEVLMLAEKPAEAVKAFERQLESTPLRTSTLVNQMKAAAAAGDTSKVTSIDSQLTANWRHADFNTGQSNH